MLDANVAEEYQPGASADIHHLSVVEQHNFDMRVLAVVARWFVAYRQDAYLGFAVGFRRLVVVGDVEVRALRVNRPCFGRQPHFRRCQLARERLGMPDVS